MINLKTGQEYWCADGVIRTFTKNVGEDIYMSNDLLNYSENGECFALPQRNVEAECLRRFLGITHQGNPQCLQKTLEKTRTKAQNTAFVIEFILSVLDNKVLKIVHHEPLPPLVAVDPLLPWHHAPLFKENDQFMLDGEFDEDNAVEGWNEFFE